MRADNAIRMGDCEGVYVCVDEVGVECEDGRHTRRAAGGRVSIDGLIDGAG